MELTELGRLGHWVDLSKLNKDSVIVDAGACIGEFIEEMRKLINCKIIAIEPEPGNFKKIKEKNFDNIKLYNNALVGEKESSFVAFYVYPPREIGNAFNLYPGATDKITVKTIKLSDLPNKIDYLKLDIEGAEMALFEQAKDMSGIKQISVEVHGNCDINKVKERLEELGFKCEKMPHSELYAIRK